MRPIIVMTYWEWFRKHSHLGEVTFFSDHFHVLRHIVCRVYGKESGVEDRLLVTAERGDGLFLEPMYALQLGKKDFVLVRLCCVGGTLWAVTVISPYDIKLSREIQAACNMQDDLGICNQIDNWGLKGSYCQDKNMFSFMATLFNFELFLGELKAQM